MSLTGASSDTRPALDAMGLLLSRDLIFTSKIKGTAAELGYPMMVAGDDSQAQVDDRDIPASGRPGRSERC